MHWKVRFKHGKHDKRIVPIWMSTFSETRTRQIFSLDDVSVSFIASTLIEPIRYSSGKQVEIQFFFTSNSHSSISIALIQRFILIESIPRNALVVCFNSLFLYIQTPKRHDLLCLKMIVHINTHKKRHGIENRLIWLISSNNARVEKKSWINFSIWNSSKSTVNVVIAFSERKQFSNGLYAVDNMLSRRIANMTRGGIQKSPKIFFSWPNLCCFYNWSADVWMIHRGACNEWCILFEENETTFIGVRLCGFIAI